MPTRKVNAGVRVGARPARLSGQTLHRDCRTAEETAEKRWICAAAVHGSKTRGNSAVAQRTRWWATGNSSKKRKAGHRVSNLSRLFVYYNERAMEGTINDDAGAMIRDGVKTLVKLGVCSERKWPYKIAKFTNKPPDACYKEAPIIRLPLIIV